MKKYVFPLLSILLLAIGWQLLAIYIGNPEIFPPVTTLGSTFSRLTGSLHFYQSVGTTCLRGIGGILLSGVAATAAAFLFSRHPWLHELFKPILTLFRSVPVISFILLALIFLNPESIPFLIAFLTMFPLLTENLTKGLKQLNPELKRFGKVFRLSRRNYMSHILYPQLKPYLFSGLASAMGFGWRAIIMGEVLSQCKWGIGSEMKKAQIFIEVPELLAWTVIAVLLSYVSDLLIRLMEKKKIPLFFKNKPVGDLYRKYPTSPILINDLCFQYQNKKIFEHLNYQFAPQQIYAISAPSGYGKTTLLKLIDGTLSPAKGDIEADRSHGIASVFPYPELLSHLTVEENILISFTHSLPMEKARAEVAGILKELEIGHLADNYPAALSMGQQQRVAIARAISYPSPILLMDEPFKGLEKELIRKIIRYIRSRQQKNRQLILFTSHQSEEISLFADHTLSLDHPENFI
ncbi:MAG: ATP-binding cassette domain-containing protein [Tannerellaceae bacterium]|nr:ATP-binding cassette domain-containing protein [Tannerellaceae bacterium]